MNYLIRSTQLSTMANTELDMGCMLTVHEMLTRFPGTAAVFTRFGVDTCCGSSGTVEEAARREGVDAAVLCADLRAAARAA